MGDERGELDARRIQVTDLNEQLASMTRSFEQALQVNRDLRAQLQETKAQPNISASQTNDLLSERAHELADLREENRRLAAQLQAAEERAEQQGRYAAEMFDECKRAQQAERQAHAALREAAKRACDAVLPALKRYRCQYTLDEEGKGDGIELVNMLCPPDEDDIGTGKMEMESLAESICIAIEESLSSSPAPAPANVEAVVEAAVKPTHRCKTCGALWRKIEDNWWQLASSVCGPCCDNVEMNDQIEALAVLAGEEDKPCNP
jgi:hypothetical protein